MKLSKNPLNASTVWGNIYIYIYIYISITKLPNYGFGWGRLGRASDELFSLEGALRTRFSRPRALSDALCASGGRPKRVRALPGAILLRFWLARTAPGAPRASIFLDFRAVFRGFSCRRGVRTKNVRHQQNTGRSDTERTSELPRDKPKTSKIAPQTLPKAFGDTNGLHERSGTARDRLGAVLGAFQGGLGAPRGGLGAPRGVPRAVLGRPGRVLDRSGGVLPASRGLPESPRGAPEAPRSILERFLLDFPSLQGRFSLDFRVSGGARSLLSTFLLIAA